MKKWFKRNMKQIFALVLVCMIACSMCIFASALNSTHVDSLSVGGVSLLSNSETVINEGLIEGVYRLNVQTNSSLETALIGTFECSLSNLYVYPSSSDSGFSVLLNNGEGIGDTSVTIRYSETLDSEILTLTRSYVIPYAVNFFIPYSDFELDSFYIHSISLTSSTTEYTAFSSLALELDDVSETERIPPSLLDLIFDVFSSVGTWISTSVQNFISMFFVDGSLTFLGVLGVAGLAISVILLLLSILVNFLRFRG